eukprot:5001520-Prorocentrum_lima.AAC.1
MQRASRSCWSVAVGKMVLRRDNKTFPSVSFSTLVPKWCIKSLSVDNGVFQKPCLAAYWRRGSGELPDHNLTPG